MSDIITKRVAKAQGHRMRESSRRQSVAHTG